MSSKLPCIVRRATLILVATCCVFAIASPGVAAASVAPTKTFHLTFDKSSVGTGVWQGTVSGDAGGGLTTRLIDLKVAGPIWLVTFDWIIDAGPYSFTARLSGILNTADGDVLMTGKVDSGYRLGAPVIEKGQLVNAATSEFVGTIDVLP
jgi:hypothetical protein